MRHLEALSIHNSDDCFRVALDESIDEAARELQDPIEASPSGKGGCGSVGRLLDSLEFAVAAVVVKPAVVGGFSRSVAIAEEAAKRGAQVPGSSHTACQTEACSVQRNLLYQEVTKGAPLSGV